MGRQYKIYVDMSTRNIYDANAAQLNDNTSPYIYYKENIQLQLQYLNAPPVAPIVDEELDKYTGLAGLTIANSAAINNSSNHYDKGALNAGKSGTVTSIVVKNLEAAPRLKAGTMLLINSAGESESVAFTNYSVTSSIYTFTVSATLTYTYLADDEVRVKETPIIKSEDADIDDTDKDTGLFLVNLDAYTQAFQELAEGKDSIANCKFEHQIFDETGKLIFALKFPFLCFGLLDDAGSIPPAPDDDYYTKTEINALLRAGYELQFSVDGSTLWHDEQADTDRHWRYRYPDGEWSPAIAMVVGPQGEKGDTGDAAPDMQIEFSIDGATLWHETFASGDIYIRTSVDGGSTWTAGMKFVGDKGDTGDAAPNVQIQYSSDNATWGTDYEAGDVYIRFSTDGGSTWTAGRQFTSSGVNTDVEFDDADLTAGVLTVTGLRSIVSIVDNSGEVIIPTSITYGVTDTTIDLSDFGTLTGTWKVIFAQGKDGADGTNGTNGTNGTSIIWKNTWSDATTYDLQEVVYYDGSSYISIKDDPANLNKTPGVDTDYWELIAEKGADGLENPMTTAGDIIYGGVDGAPTRLAKGTAAQVLKMNSGATAPEWGDAASGGLSAYGFVYRTTSKTLESTNTWYDIEFDTNGTLSNITHSTSTNTERITVSAAGIYEISAFAFVRRNGAHHWVSRLYVNGTTEIPGSFGMCQTASSDSNEIIRMISTAVVSLSASDYVTFQCGTNMASSIINVYDDSNLPNPTTTIYSTFMIKKLN